MCKQSAQKRSYLLITCARARTRSHERCIRTPRLDAAAPLYGCRHDARAAAVDGHAAPPCVHRSSARTRAPSPPARSAPQTRAAVAPQVLSASGGQLEPSARDERRNRSHNIALKLFNMCTPRSARITPIRVRACALHSAFEVCIGP